MAAVAALGAVVAVTVVLVGRSSPSTGTDDGAARSPTDVGSLGPCSTPPHIMADSVAIEPSGLVVTATLGAGCPDGAQISNNRFRLTAVDGAGHDVAAGVFDLSTTPIVVGREGGPASATFVLPAGTYWRTPESTTGGLSFAAYLDGTDSPGRNADSSTSRFTAFDVGTPQNNSLDSAAATALVDVAAADRAYLEANMLDVWQPQLSSKRPGLFADGITWQNNDILREHMEFRQRFPEARLLWSADWPVYSDAGWWVTLAGRGFRSGEAANDWCTGQGYDADHCFAKMLSRTRGASGTTLHRG